jgi:FkbM family methyltransferase
MEPVAKRAAATFALNGVKNGRIVVAALGNEDGEITFYHPEGRSNWASTTPTDMGSEAFNWIETKVPCRTLDRLMEEMGVRRVSLVKVDVEGHEKETLQGAQSLLKRDAPKVFFEYNFEIAPKKGLAPTDVTGVIDGTGPYRYRVLEDDGTLSDFPPPMAERGHVDIICDPIPA